MCGFGQFVQYSRITTSDRPWLWRANSFHEKAGECQAVLSFFLSSSLLSLFPNYSHGAKPPLSPPFHPHSLLSDCRSVQVGCTRFSRCCHLIIDLTPLSRREVGPGVSRSHLISAVELGCLNTISLLFFAPLSFFLPFPVFHRRNFELGSPSNDDRQLRRPLASPFLWGVLHFRPRRVSLSGYCAVVRTPLHSPTTDAAVPLAFSPPQQQLAS